MAGSATSPQLGRKGGPRRFGRQPGLAVFANDLFCLVPPIGGGIERLEVDVAGMPELGRQREELSSRLRSWVVGNYVIFYRPQPRGIEVVRVLHGRRNFPALFNE